VNVRLRTERYAFANVSGNQHKYMMKSLLILQILYQPQSFCDNFVASQFQDKGNCRFKTTDSYSMTMYFSMPLQKNSEYTPIFKDA
jgi:hypothetical protein